MFRIVRPQGGMSSTRARRRVGGAIAALTLGASVLTGCAAGQISQTADQIANVDGAQGTVAQVGVQNALLATPDGPDYPKGSAAKLILSISNDAITPETLTGITTDAGTVKIDGKATVEPQSLLHIGGADAKVTATVTDLTRVLKYGISVPMTFSFANAGDLSLNVPIAIPEERVPRSTVNIYPQEAPDLWETSESQANQTSPAGAAPATPGPTTNRFYTGTG